MSARPGTCPEVWAERTKPLRKLGRKLLFDGSVDATIHQNMDLAARNAIGALTARYPTVDHLSVEVIPRESPPEGQA